ncbi:MAG: hypothetical protein AMXMBFR59_36220 [Rhodanobacteraceae bacterium]
MAARALIVEQADHIAREHALGGQAVKFSCLQMMVCGMGHGGRPHAPLLSTLRRAAASVRAAGVEVGFDRFVTLRAGGNSHALVLRAMPRAGFALRALRTAIGRAQYVQGLPLPDASRFEAHVVVRRVPRPLAGEIAIGPVAWRAGEFVLVRSLTGRGVHEVVERWPLVDAA